MNRVLGLSLAALLAVGVLVAYGNGPEARRMKA
jgi:hypothetical protein